MVNRYLILDYVGRLGPPGPARRRSTVSGSRHSRPHRASNRPPVTAPRLPCLSEQDQPSQNQESKQLAMVEKCSALSLVSSILFSLKYLIKYHTSTMCGFRFASKTYKEIFSNVFHYKYCFVTEEAGTEQEHEISFSEICWYTTVSGICHTGSW